MISKGSPIPLHEILYKYVYGGKRAQIYMYKIPCKSRATITTGYKR